MEREMAEKMARLHTIIDEQVLDREYAPNPFREQRDNWIFDFRNIVLQPEYLELITDVLHSRLKNRDHYQIAGLESAAIPLVTALVIKARADGKTVNGFYVRKSRKKSGHYKHVEGKLTDDPVVIVDDLLNSGSSKMRILSALEGTKAHVDTILSIVQFRPLEAYTYFTNQHITIESIFTTADFNVQLSEKPSYEVAPYHKTLLFEPTRASYKFVNPKSTPTVAHGCIYVGTDEGYVYALDKKLEVKSGAIELASTYRENIFFQHRVCQAPQCFLAGTTAGYMHLIQ